MVKTVIQISDIHIPNEYIHHGRPYMEMIKSFLAELYDEVSKYNSDEIRIVLCGDIYHNKIKISNEATEMFHLLLNYLNEMGITYIFAGNHDMLENNTSRKDSISPTFAIQNVYPNVKYLDKELGYKSGYLIDDNIVWILYSMHDKYNWLTTNDLKSLYPDHKIIGLYHGNINGATTDIGRQIDGGVDVNVFKGCDCVMAGHIHKHQEIKKNGIPMVYGGSLFQQDSGENISGHGFVVWDLENMKYKLHETENEYRILRFEVNDYKDIINDEERLINL